MIKSLALCLLLVSSALAQLGPGGATASFKGSLPPKPSADLSTEQQAAIEKRLAEVTTVFQTVKKHERAADADIFLKAVRYALEFHEWYDKKPEDGIKKANALLDEAAKRIAALAKDQTPWLNGSGQKVVGFYSKIDGSPQPYGVEIPEGLDFGLGNEAVPMWIWLHGRGDTATDLSFVYSRLMAKKPGQFQPSGSIVIHPFGRYCNGWKSAGETDVLEARDDAIARFNVDQNRIALAGFSMGGAGAWHMGAHFADQWACVHTGAGFADVKRYTKLTPENYPSWYEQKLWGVYDVPDYARNFLNVTLVSYSGEIDAQRDSAEYMMEVLGKEGLHPPHLIGPGMPHKYHPETIKEVQRLVEAAVAKGRELWSPKVVWQGRSLAYNTMKWMSVSALEEHWKDARAEAEIDATAGTLKVTASNVAGLVFLTREPVKNITVNGEAVSAQSTGSGRCLYSLKKVNGHWQDGSADTAAKVVSKQHGLQGPIEDGFKSRFIVVLPDGKSSNAAVDAWVKAESDHFLTRWRSLMRGDAVVKKPSEVTARDAEEAHLVLWGTPESNSLLAKVQQTKELSGVLIWTNDKVGIGSQSFAASTHVPVLCQPNPLHPQHYIIVNSGLTFREAHDKTNSLQNPKLPDWAILDITQPPDAQSAGKVVAADFFDEHWQVLPRVKSPTEKE